MIIPSTRVFMIGTSAGGVAALHGILMRLDPATRAPIIVVQHLPDVQHVDVQSIYPVGNGSSVLEAEDKMPIEELHVYFAPGGYHLFVDKDEAFSLSQDEPLRYSRPSIDLSFESAARVFGPRLTAMVLTGANGDGAEGLREVRRRGGVCVVQSPEEAEYPEMPRAALGAIEPDHIVKLVEIPDLIRSLERGATQ